MPMLAQERDNTGSSFWTGEGKVVIHNPSQAPSLEISTCRAKHLRIEETIVKVPKITQTVEHLTFQVRGRDRDGKQTKSFLEM